MVCAGNNATIARGQSDALGAERAHQAAVKDQDSKEDQRGKQTEIKNSNHCVLANVFRAARKTSPDAHVGATNGAMGAA